MRARDNPFATDRLERLPYQFAPGMNWEIFLKHLQIMKHRGALVGPEGSGKTSLLEQLGGHIEAYGLCPVRLRLDREHRKLARNFWEEFFPSLWGQHVILFDGVEQLSRWEWQRFVGRSQSVGGLIITTHKPGRLPTLLKCKTSVKLFRSLTASLLNNSETANVLDLEQIYIRRHGNLRLAFMDLYDHFAALER